MSRAGLVARHLYASKAIATSHDARACAPMSGRPSSCAAPGEATGSVALESAMDEMAEKLGLDPLEFRLKNYAEIEPITDKPYLLEGAARSATRRVRRALRLGRAVR